jgi:hypothetical protein
MTAQTMLGLHATKARWASHTIAAGLDRPSSAWFSLAHQAASGTAVSPATFVASIYLALGPTGRAALGGPRSIRDVFWRQPELLPVVMIFDDRITGEETWHRYRWLGSGLPRPVTDPYTKVARAGRVVGAPLPVRAVIRIGLPDIATAEAAVLPGSPDDGPLLQRQTTDCAGSAVPRPPTAISAFCEQLGSLVGTRWNRLAGTETEGTAK